MKRLFNFRWYYLIFRQAWVGRKVEIGKGVKIQPLAFIPDGVMLLKDVFVGPGATFTNDKYPPSGGKRWQETFVGGGTVIGANATILPGVTIGQGCRIGAGAIVTKSVPGHTLVKGIW